MTYEEGVHLEAMQKASKLVARPWVRPTTAGMIGAAIVWLVLRWLSDLTNLETFLLAAGSYFAVLSIVNIQEEKFLAVFHREFHKIYGGEDAPRS